MTDVTVDHGFHIFKSTSPLGVDGPCGECGYSLRLGDHIEDEELDSHLLDIPDTPMTDKLEGAPDGHCEICKEPVWTRKVGGLVNTNGKWWHSDTCWKAQEKMDEYHEKWQYCVTELKNGYAIKATSDKRIEELEAANKKLFALNEGLIAQLSLEGTTARNDALEEGYKAAVNIWVNGGSETEAFEAIRALKADTP